MTLRKLWPWLTDAKWRRQRGMLHPLQTIRRLILWPVLATAAMLLVLVIWLAYGRDDAITELRRFW